MKAKLVRLVPKKSPREWVMAVLIVFTILAFLFTIKEVAQFVVKSVQKVVPSFNPPLEIFQQTASNMAWLGIGVLLILVSPVFLGGIVSLGLLVIGATVSAFAIYSLYNTFFKKKTKITLPDGMIEARKN